MRLHRGICPCLPSMAGSMTQSSGTKAIRLDSDRAMDSFDKYKRRLSFSLGAAKKEKKTSFLEEFTFNQLRVWISARTMHSVPILITLLLAFVSSTWCRVNGEKLYAFGPGIGDKALINSADPAVTLTTRDSYVFFGKEYNHICVSCQRRY